MSDTESTSADTAPPVSEGQISDNENSGSSTHLSPTETNIASGDGGPPPLKIKRTSAASGTISLFLKMIHPKPFASFASPSLAEVEMQNITTQHLYITICYMFIT